MSVVTYLLECGVDSTQWEHYESSSQHVLVARCPTCGTVAAAHCAAPLEIAGLADALERNRDMVPLGQVVTKTDAGDTK